MQFNCEICGKAIVKPKHKRDHYYCRECAINVARTLLKQDAAARRQIKQTCAALEDATDGGIRLAESTYHTDSVLVYHGIEAIALLLGEDIQVAENGYGGQDK